MTEVINPTATEIADLPAAEYSAMAPSVTLASQLEKRWAERRKQKSQEANNETV